MTRGERYILLRVTNDEWWDVIHFDFRTRNDKKFYVPAKYVKPLNLVVSEKECDHEGNSNFSLGFQNQRRSSPDLSMDVGLHPL